MPSRKRKRSAVSETPLVRRNGGSHIALTIMKSARKPVTLDDMTEISPHKLSSAHRKTYVNRLIECGYVVAIDGDPTRYTLTSSGLAKIYELAIQ